MAKSELISVRVAPEIAEKLAAIATLQDRSKSYVAEQGIRMLVEQHEHEVAMIQEGIDAIERGEYFTSEEMKSRIAHWRATGTADDKTEG